MKLYSSRSSFCPHLLYLLSKDDMAKNKVINNIFSHYILPVDFSEQKSFIQKYKDDMIEQVINSIEYAISNKLNYVEVFHFKNSSFVIVLTDKDYLPNLDHVLDYCKEKELFELCPKIIQLQNLLKT